MVLPGVPDADLAESIAAVLGDSLSTPHQLDGIRLAVPASVGVAWTDDPVHHDAASLIAAADAGMYAAKRRDDVLSILRLPDADVSAAS